MEAEVEAEVEAEEAGACLQLERHELRRSAGWILALIATDPDLASDFVSEGGVRALVAYASARPGETTDLEQQEEGAWAIANLSANEAHAAHIVEAGGLQLLLTLLASPSTGVRLQAVWALANLASVPEVKPRLEPAPTLTLALAPTLTLLALALTLTLALPYAPPYPKQATLRLHELGTVRRLVEWINQAARTDEGALMQETPDPSPEPRTNA